MNELAPDFTQQVLHPAMHRKILLRAAELVAMEWTRGTAARDASGQKVRSTAPHRVVRRGGGGSGVIRAAQRRCLRPTGPRGQRLRYSAVSLGGPARAPAAARTRAGPPRPGALE